MEVDYETVLREICLQVCYIATVQDILQSAVEECMISEEVARSIAAAAKVDYKGRGETITFKM